MPSLVVVGAQWGDEGKGKVVDLLTEHADLVVRFGGGANAGHTLVVGGQKIVTHLIPSGVLHPGKRCVLGEGMVVDPKTLREEFDALRAQGLLKDDQDLVISRSAHVILPLHREIDHVREQGKNAIGTTKRGIGPAYESKMARRGVRMADLLSATRLQPLLEQNYEELGPYIEARGGKLPALASVLDEYLQHGRFFQRYLEDTSRMVSSAIASGKKVLFEGAQGALLDVDHGTYPYVTSSSTIAGGACTGAGVGPTVIDGVLGISKAYTTRVGGGPFPTELKDALGDRLREVGSEFGATTGRPRRCGWLDAAALRRAVRHNGMTTLALTKLDVLSGMDTVRICTGYRVGERELDEIPLELEDLETCQPQYEDLPGWKESLREARAKADLPPAAMAYVDRVAALVGVPIELISLGPGRGETIQTRNPWG